jgi:uncharacterized protein (TIGR02145 family)
MNKLILLISVLLFTKLIIAQNATFNPSFTDSTFTDPRDGQKYPYKTIGTQVWMTKNLNYAPGGCCYNDNANNCAKYGRLYDWNTALTVAPPGWHLPSDEEWTILTTFLGGESVAGGKMKSTTYWSAPNKGATNSSGFAAVPGGFRFSDGTFHSIGFDGYYGNWWSSTESVTERAWYRFLDYFGNNVTRDHYFKSFGFSVRCIRD